MTTDYQVGSIVEGTIIAIKPFGAIMIFLDGTKGLLHISEVANVYIKNIYRYLIIGKTYQVKIISIEDDGFLKLSMTKISKEEKLQSRQKQVKRTPIDEKHIDFTALKEHLPIWVKEAQKND